MWLVHLKQVIRHSSECFNLQVSPLLCHSVNIFAWLHCWSIHIAKEVGIRGVPLPLRAFFLAKNLQYSGGKHWRALCSTHVIPPLITQWKILATPVKKALSSKIFQKFPHTANILLCKTQSDNSQSKTISGLLMKSKPSHSCSRTIGTFSKW